MAAISFRPRAVDRWPIYGVGNLQFINSEVAGHENDVHASAHCGPCTTAFRLLIFFLRHILPTGYPMDFKMLSDTALAPPLLECDASKSNSQAELALRRLLVPDSGQHFYRSAAVRAMIRSCLVRRDVLAFQNPRFYFALGDTNVFTGPIWYFATLRQ